MVLGFLKACDDETCSENTNDRVSDLLDGEKSVVFNLLFEKRKKRLEVYQEF